MRSLPQLTNIPYHKKDTIIVVMIIMIKQHKNVNKHNNDDNDTTTTTNDNNDNNICISISIRKPDAPYNIIVIDG